MATKVKKIAGKNRKWKVYVHRLCKKNGIPLLNKDAMYVLQEWIELLFQGTLMNVSHLIHSNKKITKKTVRLAFIGYMQKQESQPKLVKDTLNFGESALSKIEESTLSK